MIWLPDERFLSESQTMFFVRFLPEHSATNHAYIILFLSTNNICEKNALDDVLHTNFFSLWLLFFSFVSVPKILFSTHFSDAVNMCSPFSGTLSV